MKRVQSLVFPLYVWEHAVSRANPFGGEDYDKLSFFSSGSEKRVERDLEIRLARHIDVLGEDGFFRQAVAKEHADFIKAATTPGAVIRLTLTVEVDDEPRGR